jgi:hypothetical protein
MRFPSRTWERGEDGSFLIPLFVVRYAVANAPYKLILNQ